MLINNARGFIINKLSRFNNNFIATLMSSKDIPAPNAIG